MSPPGDDIAVQTTDLEHSLGVPISTPQTPHGQFPLEDLNPSDGSEALFSMYLDRVIEDDRRMVESWKGDADGMLVFTGLFSAAVAALLAVSIPDIRPNSQDISAFYLSQIYQQSSTQSNGSQPSIPSSLSNPTKPFSPPPLGVWVNGLWFLSLVISLTCALLATLLQQWARRYERVAYPHYSPQKRARIRAFYKHGVKKLHIPRAVDALPVLLHTSLFAFFAGLSVFVFGVHRTIFKVLTVWIGTCVILYLCLSVLPVIRKDSPYSTPLSGLFSFCLTGIRHLFFRLQRLPHIRNLIRVLLRSRDPRAVHLDDFFSHSMAKTAERYAFKLDPDIDYDSLLWTFQSLDEDSDLEKFFEGLPRLCSSETGRRLNLRQGFIEPNQDTLAYALTGLMDRTLSSNLVSDFLKQRRMIICSRAIVSTSLLDPWWILRRVLLDDWHEFLGCIEFGRFVRNWRDINDNVASFYAQCVAALTISTVPHRDERWYELASGLRNVSRPLLQKYLANGDSILLAYAIYIIRQTVRTYSGSAEYHREDILGASWKTLEKVCNLDIRRTLPELQHELCDLWNKLVRAAQRMTDQHPHYKIGCMTTLKNIRKSFIALHGNPDPATHPARADFNAVDDWDPVLDNPGFYPMCTDDSHRPSSPAMDLQFDEPPPSAPTNTTRMPLPQARWSPSPSARSLVPFPVAEPYVPVPN